MLLKKIITALILLFTLVVNILSNLLPLNGVLTGEVSDSFNVYFVPAGYVFSIWGIIYIILIAFVISLFFAKGDDGNFINGLYIPFNIGLVSNALWLFCWHYNYLYISLFFMILLLYSLIHSYTYIINNKIVITRLINITSRLLHSIYLGWICVATIANVTIVLSLLKWDGFGILPQIWSGIMIVVAGILGLILYGKYKDRIFNIVIIWSLFGIAVEFSGESTIFISSIIMSVLLFTIIIFDKISVKIK